VVTGGADTLDRLIEVIKQRKAERPEGSYTAYLFEQGQDKILKKLGEETAEVIIASKNGEKGQIVYEMSDLVYHLLVLMAYHGLTPEDVYSELAGRFK
jgi:phosphoribosyl-ATP pyrophosphohydrolase